MPTPLPISRAMLIGLLGLGACSTAVTPDAYGTFEAEDVVVSAQTTGQIQRLDVTEGAILDSGAVAAIVDTVQLMLARDQAIAQRRALVARRTEATEQLKALQVQSEIANRTWERTQRLRAGQAATAMQADQAERDVRVLGAQMDAAQAGIAGAGADLTALDAQVAQLTDRLSHAVVTNPVHGTVLTTYTRVGEMIQPGQALYSIAPLDTLTFRAYVTGDQLASFRIGQRAEVHVDGPKGLRTYPAVITWVSGEAEFTPTPVQTRNERATLVYAVKLRVANPDGELKIGMPGDVTLAAPAGGKAAE